MLSRLSLILFLSSFAFRLPCQVVKSPAHERSLIMGTLVAIHDNSISIKNDQGTFVVRTNSDTTIWRGGNVPLRELHLGDDVDVVYHPATKNGEMIAAEITANIANWWGTITGIGPQTIKIAEKDEHGDPKGPATVFFDGRTRFYDGSKTGLKVGGSLQAVGLSLGNHRMRATRVWILSLPPSRAR